MAHPPPTQGIPARPLALRQGLGTVLGWGLGCVVSAALAQDAVWRCGQTLTNQLPSDLALQRQCEAVSLPNATTVPGTRGRTSAAGPGTTPPAGRERTLGAQVSADEQRQRDGQARALLMAEKQRVLTQLQSARRSGDAAQSAQAEADLASIERELSRLP